MTDTNTAEREALMDLIDAYAEARHVGGCHTYNAKTAEARAKVVASLAASAGSEPVAPSEDVQKKIQSNTWDHFGSILPTLKAISRGDWYWGANSRCKYIEIRLDTRDGGCLLFDRERVRISPEQFAHQSYGGVKMEPWPATDLTHPSPPEGMTAEQALLKVLAAVQRYLPPDGPSAHDTMSEIIEVVDPWPLGQLEKS